MVVEQDQAVEVGMVVQVVAMAGMLVVAVMAEVVMVVMVEVVVLMAVVEPPVGNIRQ